MDRDEHWRRQLFRVSCSESKRLDMGNHVELPAGTEIAVLANQTIDSSTATDGQIFPADVAENVMDATGRVVIPKGSLAALILRSASRGSLTANAEIALDLQ